MLRGLCLVKVLAWLPNLQIFRLLFNKPLTTSGFYLVAPLRQDCYCSASGRPVPNIKNVGEPLWTTSTYKHDDQSDIITITATGQHAISKALCKTPGLINAFNMPTYTFLARKDVLDEKHFTRYDRVLAILMLSRGKTPPNKRRCSKVTSAKKPTIIQTRIIPCISCGSRNVVTTQTTEHWTSFLADNLSRAHSRVPSRPPTQQLSCTGWARWLW
ncbi:hypothetical protein KCU93_g8881, partial [Aureobasidium melanogenum]